MSVEPRGPTTEELRARVLAHESRERAEAGAARGSAREGVRPDSESAARGLGANVPLAAHPLPRDLLTRPSETETLRAALDAIRRNAEAWHGDDEAKGRALAVIARWSADPGSIPDAVLHPPLDKEKGERLGSPVVVTLSASYT